MELMTDIEREVIDILVKCGIVHDCYNKPIREVVKKMSWTADDARLFVKDLVARKLVRSRARGEHSRVAVALPNCHWEEIDEKSPGDVHEQGQEPTL